jgi:hypothetical protein
MRPAVRFAVVSLAVLAVAASIIPAAAGSGAIHPTFREERVYFKCTGQTKLYNINRYLVGQLQYKTGWGTAPPSQSLQQGGGCGGVEYGGYSNDQYDVAFEGTFTGNVRDLTIEVHQVLLGSVRTATTETLRLNMWIDEKPLFPIGPAPTDPKGRTVTVSPVPSANGTSEKFVFSITNIGYANEVKDDQGNVVGVERGGAALEDGNGSREHTFLIYLGTYGNSLDSDVKTKLGSWGWDATEIPSGITFNPGALAQAQVAADLPNLEGT